MRREKGDERQFDFHHEEVKEEISEKDEIISEIIKKMRAFEELRLVNDKNSQILTNHFDGDIII